MIGVWDYHAAEAVELVHLLLLTATVGLLASLLWLGRDEGNRLLETLLRPALLALMALLMLIVAAGSGFRWPYALVAAAGLTGVWESYSGAYRLLTLPPRRASAVRQVQVCAAWLVNVLVNLTLVNVAAHLAAPASFQWQGETASLLDVVYLTFLTFASGGYGDVLPVTPLAKGLVTLTSLAGLSFATILFAALFHRFRED